MQLLDLLLMDTPTREQRVEHQQMVRRRMEDAGVFYMNAGAAVECLKSVVGDL